MSSPQAILAHLLEGREELLREVQRLTTAIAELDTVIGRVGGPGAVDGLVTPAQLPASGAAATPAAQVETPNSSSGKRSARKTSARGKPARSAGRATARSSAARKQVRSAAAARTSAGGSGQKSIRIHVLEMLESENRDFGLAEIIDRIHGKGIEAHDDAVRSITTKLMKDGQVERVGRGQYRLTRGGAAHDSAASRSDAPAAGASSRAAEGGPEPMTASAPPAAPAVEPAPPAAQAQGESARSMPDQPAARAMGTPPLNLAEPWHQ